MKVISLTNELSNRNPKNRAWKVLPPTIYTYLYVGKPLAGIFSFVNVYICTNNFLHIFIYVSVSVLLQTFLLNTYLYNAQLCINRMVLPILDIIVSFFLHC